jgi:hypothetical protein
MLDWMEDERCIFELTMIYAAVTIVPGSLEFVDYKLIKNRRNGRYTRGGDFIDQHLGCTRSVLWIS